MRVLLLVVSLLLAAPAFAQSADDVNAAIDNVLGDHAAYEEAIDAIQFAIAEGDAAGVAAWVAYPITVAAAGEPLVLEDEAQFVEHYDDFMTDDIVEAVATQAYEELFVNSEGVMFGNGQVWINGICRDDACAAFDVRIITIQSTAE
jgi:ABC-type Co2+ transport system permease subunit